MIATTPSAQSMPARSFRKMAFPVRSDAGFSWGTNTSCPAVRNRVANCTLNSRSAVVNNGPAR